LIDHADSLGAVARFGVTPGTPPTTSGDVQWLTAGRGIQHSEMFPLLSSSERNPLELFQIWLNLPAAKKMVAPHFTMFWAEGIPRLQRTDSAGFTSEVALIAGGFDAQATQDGIAPPAPPPESFAAQADADVAIWAIKMPAHARLTLPRAVGAGTRRMLYFFKGQQLDLALATHEATRVPQHCAMEVVAGQDLVVTNGAQEAELLVLQGRPIAEPVAQYGPFVMNTQAEIHQAFADYRRTQFGGWPHPVPDPVHGTEPRRFARHADGKVETVA
jgi:redox-sensitive bicupin YhaK (pirin superfamily)